jgi:transcriptional regulator with GAF, ATPase, and Fis domain
VCVPLNFPSQAVGLVYVDRLHDNLLGAFQQRDLNLLAVLANSAAVAVVEAQRSRLLAENQQLRDQLRTVPGEERVVGASREVTAILQLLRKVSDSPATDPVHGRDGHRQGPVRAARARHVVASRGAVRPGELRGATRAAPGIGVVRPRAGLVHGCDA